MRIEVKHCVPDAVAEEVRDVAQRFLRTEPGARAGGTQQITSLYLDSPSLTFLRWHLDRVPTRFKLRVRAYGETPYSTVYVEVKQKHGVLTRKRRAAVHGGELGRILDGRRLAVSSPDDSQTRALDEFVWRMLRFGATPKVMTRSLRQSWRGFDETAVTADRAVAFRAAYDRRALHVREGWRQMPLPEQTGDAATIVELKYGGQPPAWMATLLRRLAPWRTSLSKYATAMTHLAPWERG